MTDPVPPEGPDLQGLGDQLLRLQRRRTSSYAGCVLDNSAFRILWVLDDGQPRTQRQLAAELDLDQSTVNRQLNAALAGGYVERITVVGSASKPIRPTPEGARAFAHDGVIRAELIAAALGELGAERAQRLVEDLRDFNDAWDAALCRDAHASGASPTA
ncbi:MarR family winged helix-turn-helix transcriptional regulator [Nocardioides sp.]|uniref:MarR family winged helix-turn-helix transcriptional regulator n=1 Tax=Nocardioides sp. TaxID=35761 RepID=UPI00238840BC|nr:MarR family winged helix-turn-helix transcriptional regulator [Nocardioides sp.]MDE0778553.1 MarR family winged helix-turn-helix transcriptional regulator [Nocardioides sp.]